MIVNETKLRLVNLLLNNKLSLVTIFSLIHLQRERLPHPYKSNCTKRTLPRIPRYTRDGCYIQCLANKTLAKCGCRMIGIPGKWKDLSRCLFTLLLYLRSVGGNATGKLPTKIPHSLFYSKLTWIWGTVCSHLPTWSQFAGKLTAVYSEFKKSSLVTAPINYKMVFL